jgi:glycerol dehydrogenase-like iron-containing ADH family enzyme
VITPFHSSSQDWCEEVSACGGGSPLLIVADNSAIASLAVAWNEKLSSSGWVYRVRLGEVAASLRSRETLAIASEARSLGATAIVAIGSEDLLAIAAEAAEKASRPLICRLFV